MSEHDIQRRDVLKTVGAATTFGVVGTAQGAQSDEGSVRLVEVGIEYALPDGYNYQRFHVEGQPLYQVDGQTVVVNPIVPTEVREIFVTNDVVVNGVDQPRIPSTTATSETSEALPTALAGRETPYELTQLTQSHQLPDVRIEVPDEEPVVVAEGIEQTLEPNTERKVELSPRTVTAKTARVTDEIAEIEGVPDHKCGPKTVYSSVEVEATPTVSVRDRGELDLRT